MVEMWYFKDAKYFMIFKCPFLEFLRKLESRGLFHTFYDACHKVDKKLSAEQPHTKLELLTVYCIIDAPKASQIMLVILTKLKDQKRFLRYISKSIKRTRNGK